MVAQHAQEHPRTKGWSVRWTKFIYEAQLKAQSKELILDWGTVNCISWSCQSVEVLTGHNPYVEDGFASEVVDIVTAIEAIRKRGFETLDQLVGSYWKEIPIGMAQQGDLVLVPTSSEWRVPREIQAVMPHAIAVVDSPFYWVVTPEGFGKGDLYSTGVKAFAVGRNT